MSTGIRSIDPDDFIDVEKERELDRQRQREQNISDRQRQRDERRDDFSRESNAERAERIRQQTLEANRRRLQALMGVVNDDSIELTPEMVEIVNDPEIRIMPNGEVVQKTGRDIIRRSRQFSRANIIPNLRSRKKTKTDKNMSKALKIANDKFRKANGQLRKGATKSKIMKYAHKLLKKM